jgi:chromate transporter
VVAGGCFIIPAAVLVTAIAAAYVRFGSLPRVEGILQAIKPAVIAIILQAVWKLGRTAAKTSALVAIGIASILLNLWGASPLLVLAFAGAGSGSVYLWGSRRSATVLCNFGVTIISPVSLVALATVAEVPVRLGRLFLSFLKIGAVVFGSGYVLLAFLRSEFVTHLNWLSEKQLIDAVAVGQFTPGPVFSSVTFIGWQMNGLAGAVMATVAVFLPSFVFVALLNPFVPRMRRSKGFSAFLDGVNAASVAIIVTVCVIFARESVTDWRTILIALLSLVVTFGFRRVNTVFVVAGSALAGYLLQLV